jgi:hypothetical protein
MEDVLDLYARPYNPKRPVVCFDEQPRQLIAEVRTPVPMGPGRPQRVDYEYRRAGTANLFLTFEPLAGWRHVEVTAQRPAGDFAQQMKALVEVHSPEAEVIAVVLDNLSTHSPAALYRTFRPAEALRLLKRLEFHDTPKHGSWLNMAELEFSILGRPCLDRRLSDRDSLAREVAAWQRRRNRERVTAQWRFTLADARTRMPRLYPA